MWYSHHGNTAAVLCVQNPPPNLHIHCKKISTTPNCLSYTSVYAIITIFIFLYYSLITQTQIIMEPNWCGYRKRPVRQ